jgi:thiamine biosynthesis lipoprotein
MKYHEFHAMSTSILLAAEGPSEAVETGFSQARAFIEESEKRFTRFSDQSELSRLNQSAGAWFDASEDLFEVVSQALQLHKQTQGLFDPAVLEALEQAGYNRTIEEVRRSGLLPAPSAVLVKPNVRVFSAVQLDADRQRIQLPEGMRIDLGGIAKGWIAERAANILSTWTDACAVDAGGDAFLVGLPAGQTAWRITLENPADPSRGLAILKLKPGAVATSAITKRRWRQAGQERHHLIDPRTQAPANTGWQSVTVIAPHASTAEAYAKSLLICGPIEAGRLAAQAEGIEFIAVDERSKLWGSKHSREYLDV